jgi:hypothetical protein
MSKHGKNRLKNETMRDELGVSRYIKKELDMEDYNNDYLLF